MALDYITNPTGIFFRSGKLVKKINAYLPTATTTYPADLNEIAINYDNANMRAQIEGLSNYYSTLQDQVTGIRQRLAQYNDATITDRKTVLEVLDIQQTNPQSVLIPLFNDMVAAAQAVKRCTVTLGTVTPATANVGNGTVLTTLVLDGQQPPLSGGVANLGYNGLTSQLAVTSETMTLTCTADSQVGGAQEGGERFSWVGNVAPAILDWKDEGSGQGPTVGVMNQTGNLVTDGSFENWSGTGNNTPTSWIITGGTAGTNIFREATTIYRGSYALKFTGDGTTAILGVNQVININQLKPRQRYCLTVRLRSSAVPAAGNILIQFTGTGYTAAGTEQISIPAASFPSGAWTLANFMINLPFPLPADGSWKINVQVTGTLSTGVNVWVDSMALTPVTYFGGVGLVVVAGSNRFSQGDYFKFTVANDAAGVWQTFYRRYYKFQLPSVAAGSETISDSLAT